MPTRWRTTEGKTECTAIARVYQDPARSETPCRYASTLLGNREIPGLPVATRTAGRIGKWKDVRRW
jgi:hypothetical protein